MALEIKINEARKEQYRRQGYWGDATLADYWSMAVLRAPKKTAVVDSWGTRYTYADLDEAAGKVAAYLKAAGVEPGDFVSIQLPGWAEFTVIYVACLKTGAVVNPVMPNLRANDLAYILNKCESKVLFCPSEYKDFAYLPMLEAMRPQLPSLKQVISVGKCAKTAGGNTLEWILQTYSAQVGNAARSADDLAAVLFTSGTESFPKGVMLTHNNIIASEKGFNSSLAITDRDTLLMPAPLAHATGLHHGVTAVFMAGATSVLLDQFRAAAALELIEREKCTCSMGATPFVHDIVGELQRKAYDISSLRFFLCGGAPIPRHMFKDAEAVGIRMLGVYGSTESTPHAAVHLDDTVERITTTDGVALPGIEIKVVDEKRQVVPTGCEGEEASRGPNVFVGYLKEPELTKRAIDEDGWYYSGDYCAMDEAGYIRITGRKKDVIIRGGENISSVEVENAVMLQPNVKEAAVVGMPDSRLGERICAYVVLHDRAKGLTVKQALCFFAEHKFAKAKCPERIEIVESLPRTPSGKVQKFLLRQDIKAKLSNAAKYKNMASCQ